MNYIYIGDIVNTHGIKGEVRVLSKFKYKEAVFKKNIDVYVGKNKDKLTINTYRYHKIFDMLTFYGIDNINDVLKYKGLKLYAKKEDIKINGYFDEDLIGLDAYVKEKNIGKVTNIMKNGTQDILVIEGKKRNLIPNVDAFIKKIDIKENKIHINEIEGLINEN